MDRAATVRVTVRCDAIPPREAAMIRTIALVREARRILDAAEEAARLVGSELAVSVAEGRHAVSGLQALTEAYAKARDMRGVVNWVQHTSPRPVEVTPEPEPVEVSDGL